ncbi:hypothetical protein F66182_4050 [Fusarium sp. NRRL 66182]|nr:hypothetical protein F66182_4050 [Fusarium sp. NRRL 66182]
MFAEPSSMNGGQTRGYHNGQVPAPPVQKIQIPQVKAGSRDDESVASGSSDGQMKKRLSADMSKEQVEDLVRKLTIDEMKTRWFDEIFEKVKSELVEEHSSADTPSSSEPSSPKSNPVKPPSCQKPPAPQPAVQDEVKNRMPAPQSFEPKAKANDHPSSSSRSSFATAGSTSTSFNSGSATSRASNLPPRPESAAREPSQPVPKQRPSVRFSKAPTILNERPESCPADTRPASRPPPPQEPVNQGPTLSAVDLKWGRLFDDRGEPTARLGQVLRGIANYLIAEYSPHNSLVVTPEKLHAFYVEYKLESETFPFQQIFDCRPHGALDSLETLYQHLRCEHHLVQRRPGGIPYIPALTPAGFERWMACQIQAFPEQESKRLNRIVADLPITADGPLVDGKPERLPKQISRHLLPTSRHRETHDLVVDGIAEWIKHTEENESDYRRNSSDDIYKTVLREEKGGRHRPDDYRSREPEKYRRGSKDTHRPSPLSRPDPSARFVPRVSSDSTIKPSKDASSTPLGSSHRARSPVSDRYRHSTSTVDSGSDNYDVHSQHRNSYPTNSSRRKEHRYPSPRDPKSPTEVTPRSLGRRESDRRSSLIFEETGKDPNGMTYDEYMRLNPRPMRNAVVDDGGHYRSPYSSGGDERVR